MLKRNLKIRKMGRILGLDLGTNSIGWAIVDTDQNKIVDCGVRVFSSQQIAKRNLVRILLNYLKLVLK